MDKIHNVDSATNGSPTRPVDPKTTTQPVCLTSGYVGKSLYVLWCGHRLFVSFFMCFYDLRLTCAWLAPDSAWLDNEIISPPKDITTHLNPHLIHTNTNTCTSGSLGTLKVSIRNKKTEKSECDMPHLRLTCASLYNDLISPPKHNTTHLNPHLVYIDTHTCTSGSLVTPKGSIRNKTPQKKMNIL